MKKIFERLLWALFLVGALFLATRIATMIGGFLFVILVIQHFFFAGGRAEDEELYPEHSLKGIKQYSSLIFLAVFTALGGALQWYNM